jgi:hypothetical protein
VHGGDGQSRPTPRVGRIGKTMAMEELPESLARLLPYFGPDWDPADPTLAHWYAWFKGYYDLHATAAEGYRKALEQINTADEAKMLPEYADRRRDHRAFIESLWEKYDRAAQAGKTALDRLDRNKLESENRPAE